MSALDTQPENHRRCVHCHEEYSPSDLRVSCGHYFGAPHRYADGVDESCLACWLGVGPLDRATDSVAAPV